MSPARGVSVVAKSLLGLALGAGVCYCAYRVIMSGRHRKKETARVPDSSLLERVSGISVLASVQGNNKENIIAEPASNLESHHLKSLLKILLTNSESSVQELALVTLCNSAAFSANHDIIRNLDGVRIIRGFLSDPNPKIKVNALNALNNLSMNLKNQEQIKEFITEICKDITTSPLNSDVLLAGLGLVINMSVTNNYHVKMVDYIPSFLRILVEGNEITQKYTLKVLVNMSANPLMTTPLLASKAQPSMTSLFGSCMNSDILIRALTFTANLFENVGREQHCHYNNDSLYALLFGDPSLFQRNLEPLLLHPDIEVKQQVSRLYFNLPRLKQL
ncbi:armadillo repeat-containing protein 10 isoform X1 [Pseudophryne corroboree]|uniref:armadillo repeat-containing protein 10 isoform X1 n=1 Tax=Pseudophryne corroboree TaxID=495146 RepID=UPI003081CAB2